MVDDRVFFIIAMSVCQSSNRDHNIIMHERLLKKEEPEVQETLEEVFAAEGIQRCKGNVVKVDKESSSGGHVFTYQRADGSTGTDSGDMLLVAVGRKPNTSGFGLEEIGVTLKPNGGIQTNHKMTILIPELF